MTRIIVRIQVFGMINKWLDVIDLAFLFAKNKKILHRPRSRGPLLGAHSQFCIDRGPVLGAHSLYNSFEACSS